MPGLDGADAWRSNFSAMIQCKRCETYWECTSPKVSSARIPKTFTRYCILVVPEVCPLCKSLHSVTTTPSKPAAARLLDPVGGSRATAEKRAEQEPSGLDHECPDSGPLGAA